MAADSLHHHDYDWKWHSGARSSWAVICGIGDPPGKALLAAVTTADEDPFIFELGRRAPDRTPSRRDLVDRHHPEGLLQLLR